MLSISYTLQYFPATILVCKLDSHTFSRAVRIKITYYGGLHIHKVHKTLQERPSITQNETNIPPELSDHIIDFLHDDRRALKACSLTCRTWYPTSRYHLWRKVHLHSLEGCQTFTQILQSSPYLGQFARYLNMCNIAPNNSKHPGDASELASLWPRILPALPRVEHVDASFLTIDHNLTTLLTQSFARTAELTLQYCRFHSFDDLASVLLAFPSLQRCTLRGISWDGGNSAVNHATERRDHGARLTALTLGRDLNREVLIAWLLQERLCDELDTLNASLSSEADAVILQDLIGASAKSLQHLDLDWYFSSFNGEQRSQQSDIT